MALETTLLVHGVPAEDALTLADELTDIVREHGAEPAIVGIVDGQAVVGMTRAELADMVDCHERLGTVAKANSANLGLLMHMGRSAATTVSATMELSAVAGVPIFATGGLGGVHRDYGRAFDVSADLAAFTRFPVAVVTSGVKSILDVAATREALESLGVPVVGFRTDSFPAFYLRESARSVDVRFEHVDELAAFVRYELDRTGRGIVVANPVPSDFAIDPADWERWLCEALHGVTQQGIRGRAVTPAVLSAVSEISGGETLRANLALARDNARLAAMLSAAVG